MRNAMRADRPNRCRHLLADSAVLASLMTATAGAATAYAERTPQAGEGR
ncbi:hypothetical protein [Streptomyces sp. NPDC058989]